MNKSVQTTSFIDDFENITKSLKQGENPAWVTSIREQGLTQFKTAGVPTVKDEEWKYTNLSSVLNNTFKYTPEAIIIEKQAFEEYISSDEINLVYVNGNYNAQLSNLDNKIDGLSVIPLKEAYKTEETLIKGLLSKYESNKSNSFVALNDALLDDGIFIKVDSNKIINKVIHVVHVISSSNGNYLNMPRTIISCGKSSEATILETHVSFCDDIVYLTNALSDIYLDENAVLHYYKAQKESLKAYHIGNTRVWQEKNSNFDSISVMTGSAITRNNVDIILNGEGINATIDGLYFVAGEQHVDNHTCVDHRFPNCTSNQLYKGILNESSRSVFNGKIFVQPIAQQTNSYQLNKNLLLGKNCRVDTKPQLEIFADDVKCTHGATVGQMDENELFYLETRCIGRKEAVKMLAHGFVDDLLNRIKNDSINSKLHQLLKPAFKKI